ncbi:hypothetical protein IJ556_06750 [bacterium]|nr:hypothetical protein [bacterium]MBR1750919.1 hypothetical protein [Ruminococcus sp.]
MPCNIPIGHTMPYNTKIVVTDCGCYVLTKCKGAAASVNFVGVGNYLRVSADAFGTISKEKVKKLINKAIDVYFEEE